MHFHVLQPAKKKHRARVIEFFIDVARECFNIGNFNSLMAIICEFCFLSPFFPKCTFPSGHHRPEGLEAGALGQMVNTDQSESARTGFKAGMRTAAAPLCSSQRSILVQPGLLNPPRMKSACDIP